MKWFDSVAKIESQEIGDGRGKGPGQDLLKLQEV